MVSQLLEMMPESELQDLLAQLARLYRANETNISASQVLKCKGQLSEGEILALDRFFGLFLCYTQQNLTTGTSYQSSIATSNCGPSTTAARAPLATAGEERPRQRSLSTVSSERPTRSSKRPESISERHADQAPTSSRRSGESSSGSPTTPRSPFDPETPATSPRTGETTPLFVPEEENDDFGTLSFSPSTLSLLESCKTDRGRFLREIEEARTTLPTGQGWEAAIATKEDNADLRDRMKIYHRFECYNIYRHVVEAGYHTGSHWIRDMRTALGNKLCQDFPQRFPDQKAVKKSLNWVDQGCKYHEWTGQFGTGEIALGYLIALPLDVPHSTYTSRCTQERMQTTATKLKSLGIEDLVRGLELSELGSHIATTLRDLTSRKRKDFHEDATEGSRKSPRWAAISNTPSQALTVFPNLASPDSQALGLGYSVNPHALGDLSNVNVCRSIAETYAVPCSSPFNISAYDPFAPPTLYANQETVDLDPSDFPELFSPSFNTSLGPFDKMEMGGDTDGPGDLAQLEPLLSYINNIERSFHSGQ